MCQCFAPERVGGGGVRGGEREEPCVDTHPSRIAFSSCLTPPRWSSRCFQLPRPAPPLTTDPISSTPPHPTPPRPPQSIPTEPHSTKALSVPLGPTTVAFTLDELHIWRPRVCTGSPPALLHARTAAHTALQRCYCGCCSSSLRLDI